MNTVGLNELREKYLRFFESKQHLRMSSFPLVPQNDKSLLLINSGMAPLKPYFTGQKIPPSKRVTTCQKCIRTGDIENVGKTSRHGTFFEMLGNFSFGDYFKEEIIPWAWEFMTKEMAIDESLLFVSVYEEDDEAYDIWHKKIGLPEHKIFRMGKDDNFWEVGLGPCGPCSEIYYDRGEKFGCGSPDCAVGCDCDRFMEIWNLVFTQFSKEEDGSYQNLAQKNIDTGMGLERIATVLQGVESIFDVDTIKSIRDEVCKVAHVTYNEDQAKDVSIRVITDHIRAITFMTADGVLPSNEGRGYVLRRLLRRAARHGKLLGIDQKFLSSLSQTVISISKDAYPELEDKKDYIDKVLSVEEDRFYEILSQGLQMLKDHIETIRGEIHNKLLVGKLVFRLYDTYGFPLDLTKEILADEGITLDESVFFEEMEKQKERARTAREETTYMGADETVYDHIDKGLTTEFTGYTHDVEENVRVLQLVVNNEIKEKATKGDSVSVFVERTPFYAESGGQKGDMGTITNDSVTIKIVDCIKVLGDKFAHIGEVCEGELNVGDNVTLSIDVKNRLAIARNHTTTHLLQKALRETLGTHVEQAGSSVSSERLRFDFTHFEPISPDDLSKIERIVNEKILEAIDVSVEQMSIADAKKIGAMALFGEKYGNTVRVVTIPDFSTELCGGTHLKNTAQAGSFKLLTESGVASGVRRIEAVTGTGVLDFYEKQRKLVTDTCQLLRVTPENMVKKLEFIINESKSLDRELEKLRNQVSFGAIDDILHQKQTVGGLDIILHKLDDLDMNGLRTMGDKLKEKIGSGVILLGSAKDDKVNFVAMATDDAVKKGVHAGQMIKNAAAAAGGSGGGRPNMAQAGAKDVTKIEEALNAGLATLKEQLGAK